MLPAHSESHQQRGSRTEGRRTKDRRTEGGSSGRRANPFWQTNLFLLSGPDIEVLPPSSELAELSKLGLGQPVHESTEAGQTRSKIELNWSLSELNNFVCQSYPLVSLNLVGFELARTGKGRKIQKLQVSSVRELKKAVGKSRVYILPRAAILQLTSPPSARSQNSSPPLSTAPAVDETSQMAEENVVSDQVTPTSSAISQNSFPPLSTAPVQDGTILVAESTQAQNVVSDQALQEWRAIRAQQDQEYNETLLEDQEKEMKKRAYQAFEERHQKAIQARRQRMAACEEPSDGVSLKFKYPNGYVNMRKFCLSETIQVLFDFVGQHEMASEIFKVQEATSSRSIESNSFGSIMDHDLKASSTLYVLWLSNQDVQEIISGQQNDGAYALHHASPGQPLLSVPSTQPPLSVPSTQPPLSVPSTQPSLSVSSTQPSLSVSSTQPPLTLFSTQPPLTLFSTQPPLSVPSTQPPLTLFSTQPPLSVPSTQPPLNLFSYTTDIQMLDDGPLTPPSAQDVVIIVDEQEEPVSQNLSPVSQHQLGGPVDETDLQNILTKLVSKIDESFCPTSNQINVCRNNVLLCSLRAFKRRNFNPEAKLDVVFVDEDGNGEGAVDEGGPTREYLRLLMRAIHQSNIFEGHEKDRQLSLDTQALQTNLYTWVAKMIAVCVVHGGVGPHFFSERLFQQICGIPTSPTIVDEVCDHTFRQQLIKIQEATTVQEANSAIAEAADSLSIIGALRHVSNLKEKDSLVQSAADFFVNGRMQTALDQFVEGFRTLGLLEELRENPAVFHSMFVSEERPLQAKDLFSLFGVDYSVQGSNNRAKENSTICYWRDWLIDVEEGECSPITLEKVLEFSSGASTVPPFGFPHRPQIHFIHEANRVFPEANTCLLILRLPIHSDYEDFRKYMKEGILQAPTFGVV